MNDLISRQVAIDAFLTELTKRERKNLIHTWSTVEVKYFVVDMLEKSPSAQPERKWIPWSSGKLPEESGTYTVTAYDGVTNRVTYAKYQKRLKRWELTGARAYWRVLAWMPLPEPYRGERTEE